MTSHHDVMVFMFKITSRNYRLFL